MEAILGKIATSLCCSYPKFNSFHEQLFLGLLYIFGQFLDSRNGYFSQPFPSFLVAFLGEDLSTSFCHAGSQYLNHSLHSAGIRIINAIKK